MRYKLFSEAVTRKDIYLKLLKDRFNGLLEFKNFEKLSLRSIKSIYIILKYFQNKFGNNIFNNLNYIIAVEDKKPLGSFSIGNRCIRISLEIFGENPDQSLSNKWKHPERIFIHEFIHYLISIPNLSYDNDESNHSELVLRLRKFVKENTLKCVFCTPNLYKKHRKIESIPMLAEEFVCEVMSIYILEKLKNPEISIESIFGDRLKYCKEALKFYEELKGIIKEII